MGLRPGKGQIWVSLVAGWGMGGRGAGSGHTWVFSLPNPSLTSSLQECKTIPKFEIRCYSSRAELIQMFSWFLLKRSRICADLGRGQLLPPRQALSPLRTR